MAKIRLGTEVKDLVSGYIGIAVAKVIYFNRCIRWEVQSRKVKEDGSVVPSHIFDQEQLEVVGAGLERPSKEQTGGDRPAPTARTSISR